MKKLFLVLSLGISSSVVTSSFSQQLPPALEEDAEMLFADDASDVLDNVTLEDCKCSQETAAPQKPTLVQVYYQAVLLGLLNSYFSVKHSYAAVKNYLAYYVPWLSCSSQS